MTATKPEVSPAGRYTIQKASEVLGVSKTSVRRYMAALRIRPTYRKSTKVGYITGSDIVRMWSEYY